MSSHDLRFLPVAIDIREENCYVVGGGQVGTRKAMTLMRAAANVTIISPTASEELVEQINAGRLHWVKEAFREEHLIDPVLTVAATNDEDLNATVVRLAAQAGSLVCDASSAERSQVIFGALHQHQDVTIAVFTDGRDPALARRTRDRVTKLLG